MKTWTPAATVKQTTCLCRDTGGKGTLPAQHTTFNTLDNWAIKTPPNQKGKGPERKGYRVMAWNMYTIHSVTYYTYILFWDRSIFCCAIVFLIGIRMTKSFCSLHVAWQIECYHLNSCIQNLFDQSGYITCDRFYLMLHACCLSCIPILSCYACKVPAYYAYV